MFAAQQVTVGAPYHVVSARLSHVMNWRVLNGAAEAAFEGGLETFMRVGPFGGTPGLSRLVQVRVLEPVRWADKTIVPMRWQATGVTGEFFPALDADLVLTPEGESATRVELVGIYRPPLGRVGMALDRAVMKRVAEATLRSLVERAAAALATPVEESTTGTALAGAPLPNLDES